MAIRLLSRGTLITKISKKYRAQQQKVGEERSFLRLKKLLIFSVINFLGPTTIIICSSWAFIPYLAQTFFTLFVYTNNDWHMVIGWVFNDFVYVSLASLYQRFYQHRWSRYFVIKFRVIEVFV